MRSPIDSPAPATPTEATRTTTTRHPFTCAKCGASYADTLDHQTCDDWREMPLCGRPATVGNIALACRNESGHPGNCWYLPPSPPAQDGEAALDEQARLRAPQVYAALQEMQEAVAQEDGEAGELLALAEQMDCARHHDECSCGCNAEPPNMPRPIAPAIRALLSAHTTALAEAEARAERLARMLGTATVRLGILRDRMEACDADQEESEGEPHHELSLFEIKAWVEEQLDVLRAALASASPEPEGK